MLGKRITLVAGNVTVVAGNVTLVVGNVTLVAGNVTHVARQPSLGGESPPALWPDARKTLQHNGLRESNQADAYVARHPSSRRIFLQRAESCRFSRPVSGLASYLGIPNASSTRTDISARSSLTTSANRGSPIRFWVS